MRSIPTLIAMTKLAYMRLALVAPFLAGACAFAFQTAGLNNMLIELIVLSVSVGAAPLLVTVAIIVYISLRSDAENFQKWWLSAPALMALICGLFALGIALHRGVSNGWDSEQLGLFAGVWFIGGMYSLIVGYAYVGLAVALYFILRWAGAVKRDAPFVVDE